MSSLGSAILLQDVVFGQATGPRPFVETALERTYHRHAVAGIYSLVNFP